MNAYEDLKRRVDIVDLISDTVNLKRNGKVLKGLCPFHDERTPSFTVYRDSNSYHCFGCEESGTVIDFVMKQEGFQSPADALTCLSERYDIPLQGFDMAAVKRKKTLVQQERKKVANHYGNKEKAQEYVLSRGISHDTAKAFGLGYNADSNAVSIPILNTYSEVVGSAERFLGEGAQPKYKNSPESEIYKKTELLFGLDKARKRIKDKVYIVEGYFDVLAMHEMGLPESIAYCGQAITEEQSRLLSNYVSKKTKIYLIPDNDRAGKHAVKKNVQKLRLYNKNRISVIELLDGCKDANDLLVAGKAITDLKAEPIEFHLLKQELDECMDIEDEYFVSHEYAKMTQNKMLRADMAKYLAERWNKPVDVVRAHMNSPDSVQDYSSRLYTASEAFISQQKKLNTDQTFFTTGLTDVDEHLKEIKRKEVMFILGRSGSGKTTFVLNLIYNMVMRDGENVIFNSLELAKEAIIPQLIQIHKKMPSGKVQRLIRSGEADQETMQLISKLDEHFRIADQDSQTLKDLENYVLTANETVFHKPVSVVVVDYFQYLKSEGKRSTYEEKSDMARELKALAKRLNVLMVVLTQANREGGGGGDRPLSLTSARDTGAIEESGDYVLGLYQPSANTSLTKLEKQEVQHEMYCQLLKNRWGMQNVTVGLYFEGMTKRIEDVRGRF